MKYFDGFFFHFQKVQSSIDPSVKIGHFSEIARDVIINANSAVGSYSDIGAGSKIGSDTKIGNYVTLSKKKKL